MNIKLISVLLILVFNLTSTFSFASTSLTINDAFSIIPLSLTNPEGSTFNFDINSSPVESYEGHVLQISKKFLGVHFLLIPSIIVSTNVPIHSLLMTKIVYFQKYGDRLGLFEWRHQQTYTELEAPKLLQTFMIYSDQSDSILFFWKFGLESVSVEDNLVVSDFEPSLSIQNQERVLLPTSTLIKQIEVSKERLFIEQISKINGSALNIDLGALLRGEGLPIVTNTSTVRIYFEIRLYEPSEDFKIKYSKLSKGIGYFENPEYQKGELRSVFQTTRWNLNKGFITYALSKNIPEEIQSAVEEGVLYWNKTLGKEMVRVEKNVDPEETPRDRRVIIHWAHFDNAGFARANMQWDPLTGELIRGNVYLSSAFLNVSTWIQKYLQKETLEPTKNGIDKQVLPEGLMGGAVCHYDLTKKQQEILFRFSSLNKSISNNKQYLYIKQDFIREVVAHEVGHTLGLRHNFSGSQDAEWGHYSKYLEDEHKYLEGKLQDGALASSSVMDYNGGFAGGMLGAYLKNKPLPYDEMVIHWGYDEQTKIEENKQYSFCSDGILILSGPIGCAAFDIGRDLYSPQVNELKFIQKYGLSVIYNLILNVVFAKDPRDRISLEKTIELIANNSPKVIANFISSPLKSIFETMREKKEFLFLNEQIGFPSWWNFDGYNKEAENYLKREIEKVGSLSQIVDSAFVVNNETHVGWMKEGVEHLIQSSFFAEGTTLSGVPYSLNQEDQELMKKFMRMLAVKVEPYYVGAIINSIVPNDIKTPVTLEEFRDQSRVPLSTSQSKPIRKEIISEDFERYLGSLASGVLFTLGEMSKYRIDGKEIVFIDAYFPLSVRKQALYLMNGNNFGKSLNWLKSVKQEAFTYYLNRVRSALNSKKSSSYEFKADLIKTELPLEYYQKIMEEIELLKEIEGYEGWPREVAARS